MFVKVFSIFKKRIVFPLKKEICNALIVLVERKKRERFYFDKSEGFRLAKVKKITGLNPIKLIISVSLSLNTIIWSLINYLCCLPLQSK